MQHYTQEAVRAAAKRAHNEGRISIEQTHLDTGLDRATVRSVVRGYDQPHRRSTLVTIGRYLEQRGVVV